ncbi:MAG TPA: TetR/AcrR family transcriptional regulator [Tepidiformaceae bacterium]|nr:TetR/AcrR family transcriptional regulator [Tepidiformaceae bacterium]
MRSKIGTDGQEPSFIEAARRSQIIDCAIEALAEVGFQNTSLAEIAKRARISKSVILYYFDGKAQLLREVMTTVYTRGHEFMFPRIQASASYAEALRNYIHAEVEFVAANWNSVRAAMEIAANNTVPGEGPAFEQAESEWLFSSLEALFKGGQESGEFRPFSTRVMAMTLRSALDGIPRQVLLDATFDLSTCAEELTTLFDLATRKGAAEVQAKPTTGDIP